MTVSEAKVGRKWSDPYDNSTCFHPAPRFGQPRASYRENSGREILRSLCWPTNSQAMHREQASEGAAATSPANVPFMFLQFCDGCLSSHDRLRLCSNMRFDRALAIPRRHQELLRLVRSGDYSASGLAQALHVSEPTVNRDILFLRQSGHPIVSVRIQSGWAYRLDQSINSPRTARRGT